MDTINISVVAIFLFYLLKEIITEVMTAKRKDKPPKLDKSSFLVLHLAMFISAPIGYYLGIRGQASGFAEINWGFPYVSYLGLFLMAMGITMKVFAQLTLKNQFTNRATITDKYKLITSGLYAYIRHPAYLGNLMLYFGIGIALANWVSILIIGVPVFFAHLYRISFEEKLLVNQFGNSYTSYCKKTKRIIPLIY